MLLSVLRTHAEVAGLERSGRLLRRRFAENAYEVAAWDKGAEIAFATPAQVAASGFTSIEACWSTIGANLDARLANVSALGSAPFWFLDAQNWPAGAYLSCPNLSRILRTKLETDRPLMVGAFSAEQLLIGYADSMEFHDRLTHAREAPVARPLLPLPYLLEDQPRAIRAIEIDLGVNVWLHPEHNADTPAEPLEFALLQ